MIGRDLMEVMSGNEKIVAEGETVGAEISG